MTDTVTLTGDNNYSGTYTEAAFWVLGGASDGGHDDTDSMAGNEAFVFGNLNYRSTVITDTTYDNSTGTEVHSGTFNTTATATSGDTLHFAFEVGSGGTQSFFDSSSWHQAPNADHDYTYEAEANHNGVSGWLADWQASVLASSPTATFSGSQVVETQESDGIDGSTGAQEVVITLNGVTATVPGSGVTADHGGDKILMGFSVDSDHIVLDNITSETMFSQYFDVSSTTHSSANNTTVNDTTIALHAGGWSVDLYGVDTHALTGQALIDFAWNHIISHA